MRHSMMRHSIRRAILPAVILLASVTGFAVPAQAATSTVNTQLQLTRAFEDARHVPGSAIGGIRQGSLHVADGWAIATFDPANETDAAGFQDGAATGVFAERNGAWQLVRTGPYGCATELPTALREAWDVTDPASCTAAPAATAATRKASAQTSTTGLAGKIVSTALSQVGVTTNPVVGSFNGVDCNPYSTLVAGFSANANGCGYNQAFNVENENETWCSDFAKWVWERAGVTEDMNTLNAGSISFYDWGLDQGESMPVDSETVAPGDAIVFFGPGTISPDTYADHVGLVTSVNSDGTIDMANGDFLGATDISVEHDTEISLPSWSAEVWGQGEQWIVVTPPLNAQQPVPVATMSGPRTAEAGTAGAFRAAAHEPGGSISEYYWTFGDGRSTNTTGADVSHVFYEDGEYPVTVTVTSSFGTITTKTWNVDVSGVSSAVAAVPSDAVWFATTPVDEYLFTRSSGGLAVQAWDGASWLELPVPGDPTGQIAALSYPDPVVADAMTPHAYYRSTSGALAETYLGSDGWVTQSLPGSPAPGAAIVATYDRYPTIYFLNDARRITQVREGPSGWTATTLPGPPGSDPTTLTATYVAGRPVVVYAGPGGWLRAGTTPLGVRGAAVAAVGGTVYVAEGHGRLASVSLYSGRVRSLPGAPADGTSLAATTYLLPSGGLGTEVFYLTASGAPGVTYSGGQTGVLPGTGSALVGVNAYQVAGQPTQVFLSSGIEDTAAGPSGPWTVSTLPTAPASFAGQVLLYAATTADDTAALAAAAAAGLPASQVTTSFATAWDAALTGNYLVIAVGLPATDGLYFNVCGWSNPSTDIPGSTPFYITGEPLDQLPGAGAFEEAAGTTASGTAALAADLAYYAVNGALPSGVTSLPAAASPEYVCAGTP
jgi:hypothetical protein